MSHVSPVTHSSKFKSPNSTRALRPSKDAVVDALPPQAHHPLRDAFQCRIRLYLRVLLQLPYESAQRVLLRDRNPIRDVLRVSAAADYVRKRLCWRGEVRDDILDSRLGEQGDTSALS